MLAVRFIDRIRYSCETAHRIPAGGPWMSIIDILGQLIFSLIYE